MKKQTLYGIFGAVIVTLACSLGSGIGTPTPVTPTQAQVDEVGTLVAATLQALTPPTSEVMLTETPTQISGTSVSCGNVSFVLPNGVAGGANAEAVPAVNPGSDPQWDVAPAHTKCTLTGYALQNKFHEPRIFVYPAEEFAQVHSGAAQEIDRIKKILGGLTPTKDTLPIVPFFNAGPLFVARIQVIPFQAGNGVRALTQYAQYSAPINNRELFYHFQGLTSDNKYYVIVLLPITAPILQENETPQAPIPANGVPFPANGLPDPSYYVSITDKLNALSPDAYAPSLNALDALIGSILVTNP